MISGGDRPTYRPPHRPLEDGQRPVTKRSRRTAVALVAAALVGLPGIAMGDVATHNFLKVGSTVDLPLVAFHDYTNGSQATWTSQSDFAGTVANPGTFAATSETVIADSIALEPIGPDGTAAPNLVVPWWDTDWNTRHCVDLDHTDPVSVSVDEYQFRVALPIDQLISDGFLQADTGDLRAVAADGATQLPLWVDSTKDAVWVQMDAVPAAATTHFCLYYGHNTGSVAPLANHTETAVFTYSTQKPIYYTVDNRSSLGGGRAIHVASYVDGNLVTRDNGTTTVTQTLNDTELASFSGNNATTIYRVTGPISARMGTPDTNATNGFDTLVPISWAGRRFIIPSERGRQRLSVYAPFGAANVTIYEGAVAIPIGTVVVPAGTAIFWTEPGGDPINNESVLVEADAPVLLFHAQANGNDSFPVHPAVEDEWFGVSSRGRYGSDTDGTEIDLYRSNTAAVAGLSQSRGGYGALSGGSQGGGINDGLRVIVDAETIIDPETSPMDARISIIAQADGDGSESATFFPKAELNSRYLLPTNSQYVAVACPDPDFALDVLPPTQPARAVTCSGVGTVGWARDTANLNISGAPAAPTASPANAIDVRSPGGEPFYAYYEHRRTNDETNLLGMKQGRQYTWPEPVETHRTEGLFSPTGTWESPTFDTGAGTEVFGGFAYTAAEISGVAEVRFQVATDDIDPPSVFVGPDGTAGTWFSAVNLSAVLDFGHDDDRYLRVLAELTTSDQLISPRLDDVTVDHHLALLDRAVAAPGTVNLAGQAGVTETHYVLRITTTDPTLAASLAHAEYLSGVNLANLAPGAVRLENRAAGLDSVQLVVSGGPPVPVAGPDVVFDAAASHSLVFDATPAGSGDSDIVVRWDLNVAAGGSIFVEGDVTIHLSVP